MISYNESLEMENPWAMKFDEAPTLESKEKDSLDDMGVSSLKYHKNFAHLMPLQSQACLVPRAHTIKAITPRCFPAKSSGGWL